MGTFVNITLPKGQNKQITKSFETNKTYRNSLSSYDPNATLTKLNQTHPCASDTYLVKPLNFKNLYNESNGYFDVTIGSISKKLYRFGEENNVFTV